MVRCTMPTLTLCALTMAAEAQVCQPYWSSLDGLQAVTKYLEVFDDGTGPALFVAGYVALPGQTPFYDDIAKWRPRRTEVIATSICGSADWLTTVDLGAGPMLVASGVFCDYSIPSLMWYARWTGTTWTYLPPGLVVVTPPPYFVGFTFPAMLMHTPSGPRQYGTLRFAQERDALVMWNGETWKRVDPIGANRWMEHFCHWRRNGQDVLVVSGEFTSVAGVPANKLAIFNGATWEGFATRPAIYTRCMKAFDDGTGEKLYIAGGGTNNGGSMIWRWDGSTWSDLGNPLPSYPGTITHVEAMEVFDDGRGPALFVAGVFNQAGGVPARNFARYDGTSWSAVGVGLGHGSSYGYKLKVFGDSLVIGGQFLNVGGGQSEGLARWVSCRACYPDCDENGRLDTNDFLCFLAKHAALDPYANCTVDATIDASDFVCFMNKYAAGCDR